MNARCESRSPVGVRCDLETGHDGQHRSSHALIDHLSEGVNAFECECGERLYPDCDMSSVSIAECFTEHLRDVGVLAKAGLS